VVAIHHPLLLGTLLNLFSFARENNDQHAIVRKRETNTHRKITISKKEPERNGKDGQGGHTDKRTTKYQRRIRTQAGQGRGWRNRWGERGKIGRG